MATSTETVGRRPGASWLAKLTVVTATSFETWVTKRRLPRSVRIVHVGIGAGGELPLLPGPVVVCGLAGALASGLKPGTIVIPEWVGLPTGERITCYAPLVTAFVAAARRLGAEPVTAPLLTTPGLVTGAARTDWALRGFAAVDMESAQILRQHPHTAVVRVILDTPERELAADWEHPASVVLAPRLWPAATRLAFDAPRAALRAADVVRAALAGSTLEPGPAE